MKKLLVSLTVAAFALSACSSDKQPRTKVIVIKPASVKHKPHHHKKTCAFGAAANCK
jgi:uncharacterized protein YcfL